MTEVSSTRALQSSSEDAVNASLVTNEIYPDSSDTTSSGSDQIKYTYNVDGSRITRTDQRGTVMTYAYDNLRRLQTDSVTTLGGADATVLSIKRVYDSRGRIESVSSHSGTAGTGSVLNEIEYVYNELNQITTSYQNHSGAVNTSTSPKVQYSYDATRSGNIYTRSHRLDKVTHPSGRITFYGYNTGSADSVHNRAGMIRELRQTDGAGTQYSQYDYLGSGRLAVVDYQAPDIKLDYYQAASGTDYAGYDRFGRIKDQFWDGYGSTADVSRIKHGYDYAGNRLWREDVIASNNGYHHDEFYTYDGLHRLLDNERGNLNGTYTGISSNKNFAEDWALDTLGNWSTFKQDDDGNGSWDLNQFRSHNAANEIATIQFTSAHVAHDAAGNMTKTPKPDNWSAHHDLTYDGWNRLVKVADGGTTVAEFRYDGKNRRIIKYDGPTSSPTATYDYYYNAKWQTLEVRKNADVNPLEEFAWHPYYIDALAVRFYDSDVNGSQVDHYYSQDANFNVVAIANSSGAVQERYLYSAYGQTVVLGHASLGQFAADEDNVSDVGNDVVYTGRLSDAETGLHYYRNRYLNAKLGRFVTRDPLGYVDGTSSYSAYFILNKLDPSGTKFVLNSLTGTIQEMHELGFQGLALTGLVAKDLILGRLVQTLPTESGIDNVGVSCDGYCAWVNSASSVDINVMQFIPNNLVAGGWATEKGNTAIQEHEARRLSVYRKGYDEFLEPVQGRGRLAVRCGRICNFEGKNNAMYDLYDYLAKLRQEAISKYMDYVRREQRAISEGDIGIYIDADPNSDAGKFGTTHDGYSATYAVQAPDEYNTEIPCPNAFGSFPLD